MRLPHARFFSVRIGRCCTSTAFAGWKSRHCTIGSSPFPIWCSAKSAFATRLPIALAMVGLVLLRMRVRAALLQRASRLLRRPGDDTLGGAVPLHPHHDSGGVIRAGIYRGVLLCSCAPGPAPWRRGSDIGERRASSVWPPLTRAGIGALFPSASSRCSWWPPARGLDHRRRRRRLAAIPIWSAGAIALLVALPWHVAASLRTPGFLWFYFVNEQVLRAIGKRYPADCTAVPLGIWWAAHAVWFFPWIVFAGYAWRERPPFNVWKNTSNVSCTSASPHVHLGGSDLSLLLARFRIADGVSQFWRVAGGRAADRSRAGSRGSAQRRVAASTARHRCGGRCFVRCCPVRPVVDVARDQQCSGHHAAHDATRHRLLPCFDGHALRPHAASICRPCGSLLPSPPRR